MQFLNCFVVCCLCCLLYTKLSHLAVVNSKGTGDTHHRLARPCWQDCEVIGWAELCERKRLTAGSCFQLEWLGHWGFEECDA